MSFLTFFDTDAGRTRLQEMETRLQRRVKYSNPPSEQAHAWAEYRQERYVETGMEGLSGPDACYHFTDAADYIAYATDAITGTGWGGALLPVRKRPVDALRWLAKGYGYRHIRAVDGLRDALISEGTSQGLIGKYDNGRKEFMEKFEPLLDAAQLVNTRGENPQAARSAVVMFADELDTICGWLEVVGNTGQAAIIQQGLTAAMKRLASQDRDSGR